MPRNQYYWIIGMKIENDGLFLVMVGLETPEIEFHRAEYERIVMQLETDAAESNLAEAPDCVDALNDLLIRLRVSCVTP